MEKYYDLTSQEYKEAKLIKNDKEEVAGIEFSLNEMANSVSIRYQTADGKTAQGLLTFVDMSKQEVNKDSLKEIINTAQEKLKDAAENPENYDSKAVSALQTAVSNGTEVFKNPVKYSTVIKILGKNNTLASPVEIPTSVFTQIYNFRNEK